MLHLVLLIGALVSGFQQAATVVPGRPVRVIPADGSPFVTLDSASIKTVDQRLALEVALTGTTEDDVVRAEVELLVFDEGRELKDRRTIDLPRDALPTSTNVQRRCVVDADGLSVGDGDRLFIVLRTAWAASGGFWSGDTVDAKIAEMLRPQLVDEPVVVINPPDAPATLVHLGLIAPPVGPPISERVLIRNPSDTPIISTTIGWALVDDRGRLRAAGARTAPLSILPKSEALVEIPIRMAGASGSRRWIVVVALARVRVPSREWSGPSISTEARKAVWKKAEPTGQPPCV